MVCWHAILIILWSSQWNCIVIVGQLRSDTFGQLHFYVFLIRGTCVCGVRCSVCQQTYKKAALGKKTNILMLQIFEKLLRSCS